MARRILFWCLVVVTHALPVVVDQTDVDAALEELPPNTRVTRSCVVDIHPYTLRILTDDASYECVRPWRTHSWICNPTPAHDCVDDVP